MSLDAYELTGLADHLAEAGDRALPAVRAVVAKGSLNIKKDVQKRWSGFPHAPALPRAVTYDTELTPTGAIGEIGPEKGRRQWGLGTILEFGTRHNRPHPALAPALAREAPRFERALEQVAVKAAE